MPAAACSSPFQGQVGAQIHPGADTGANNGANNETGDFQNCIGTASNTHVTLKIACTVSTAGAGVTSKLGMRLPFAFMRGSAPVNVELAASWSSTL